MLSRRKQSKTAQAVPAAARVKKSSAMDTPFLITVLILVVFGLIMLFSASYATALYRFGDSFHYIKDQAIFAIIGVTAMLIASKVDYHIFHRLAWPLMAISMILLVVVLFMPAYNNAHRWITIKGLGTLQPSEIAKFTIIVLFAHIISVNYAKMKTFSYGVIPFMMVLAPVVVLMLLEPHLSGTILILSIGAIMMFVGGTSLKWFGLGGGVAVGGLAAALIAFPDLVPYAMSRIEMWQNPYLDIQGKGHQTIQSLLAIGSGGVMGLGLGNSRQKHLYVPEPQNDFIFSIICEELGFIGAMVVILLFVLLLVRGAVIAINAKDKFGAMLVVGIIAQVTVQAVLNIAVVTNTVPNTGISLPFFSYGGTSLMMLLGEMGIVLSVSRQSRLPRT